MNNCPKCQAEVPSSSMNIAQGVALCPGCGVLTPLRDLIAVVIGTRDQLTSPPSGCSFVDLGTERILTASTRSGGIAGFFLIFSIFWNSITGLFVVFGLIGLYEALVGPLPASFPIHPKMQGKSSPMAVGEALFVLMFMIPFILVGIGTAYIALLGLVGKVTVRISDTGSSVFTGVGRIGWRRRFDARQVKGVKKGETEYRENGRTKPLIILESDPPVRLGSLLLDERREWLGGALQQVLVARP